MCRSSGRGKLLGVGRGGLQAKLTLACGSLLERRTGSLSAAYKNLEEQMFTQSFEALCADYQLRATRNNKGISHEYAFREEHQAL